MLAAKCSGLSVFRKIFKQAVQMNKPVVIDVRIDKDEMVLPMLPPGGAIDDIITKVKI